MIRNDSHGIVDTDYVPHARHLPCSTIVDARDTPTEDGRGHYCSDLHTRQADVYSVLRRGRHLLRCIKPLVRCSNEFERLSTTC